MTIKGVNETLLAVEAKPEVSVIIVPWDIHPDQELYVYSFVVEGGNHRLLLHYTELHVSGSDSSFHRRNDIMLIFSGVSLGFHKRNDLVPHSKKQKV